MKFNKHLFTICLIVFGIHFANAQQDLPITEGPYQASKESFKQYQCPEWFKDAKFGIWSHWGPQAVPRMGDWYARNMYIQYDKLYHSNQLTGKPSPDYTDHLNRYGHPSKQGYKDIIPLWKAEKFNPEYLMSLYKKAGAKYFVSMGTHHDNFFLWKSKIHRWNAVDMGPHKDIVGLWQQAAKKQGLRFGVSEHLGASYSWFQTSHGADSTGSLAGVPYDGNDPAFQDLYHKKITLTGKGWLTVSDKGWLTSDPQNQREWYNSIKELVDNYHPDLLYSDSYFPFGDVGNAMLANFYNDNLKSNKGKMQAVYNCKEEMENRWVLDIERGVTDKISPFPWQTDTSIGDWFYRTGQKYKSVSEIIQMLVDIVSKNGNLLINIVQTPEGDIEPDMVKTLEGIGEWTSANGEGIYGSRPWKIYGEGPSTTPERQEKGGFGGLKDLRKYEATDIRFTTKDGKLFVFLLQPPTEDIKVVALGNATKMEPRNISSITLLGSKEKVKWSRNNDELVITKPSKLPKWDVLAFKVEFKK